MAATRASFAGLGLWGVRIVPVVGRVAERDALWEAFVQVATQRAPRSILLRGGAGSGKSRLAQWLCRRAHERGVAHVMVAEHGQSEASHDAVASMMREALGAEGLDGEELVEQLGWALGEREHGVNPAVLAALLQRARRDSTSTYRSFDPKTRAELLRRAIAQLAGARPVIIWLDDVQWGPETVTWAQGFLDAPDPVPALFVMTARDEALREAPWVAKTLDEIAQLPSHAGTITLGALSHAHHVELAQEMLGLSPSLARHVASRAQGNPLFATQLVNHWVERGVLVSAPGGLEVLEGALLDLPDDIYGLWSQRIDHLAAGFGRVRREQVLVSVSLAAVLGDRVSQLEWEALCAAAGVGVEVGLVARLISAGLAVSTERGWGFAHGMLRETIARRAREQRH